MILVQHILDAARQRLAVLGPDALIAQAAVVLSNPETPLVVVCDEKGVALGVISRSDLVRVIACGEGEGFATRAGAIMTRSVLSCHVDESLQRVWTSINARSLRCAPVLDDAGRPQGVVHARDVARALLDEATLEEELLRDYVLGVGYQ